MNSRPQRRSCSSSERQQSSSFRASRILLRIQPLIFLLCALSCYFCLTVVAQAPHDDTLVPRETNRKARGARNRNRHREETAAKQPNLLEKMWNRFLHHDNDDDDESKQDDIHEQQEPPARPHAQRRRRVTRRRALYEHSLQTHYLPKEQQDDDDDHSNAPSQQQRNDLSSWMDQHDCVFYNENRNSHWTYQWCPPNEKRHGTLKQQHWKPRVVPDTATKQHTVEWRVTQQHLLGTYVEKPTKQDAEQWRVTLGYDVDPERVEYYRGGEVCRPSGSKSKEGRTARKGLVVKHPQVCEQQTMDRPEEKWRILAVMEPTPCQYVVYVCENTIIEKDEEVEAAVADDGVDEEDVTSDIQESDTEGHKDEVDQDDHVRTRKEELAIQALRAYMYESGVDMAHVETADRSTSLHIGLPPFPPSRSHANRDLIRDMFQHAYDSYMFHAFPASELQPLTCTPGTFDLVRLPALTLVDSLDMLVVMGNVTEFARSVERLRLLHQSMEGGLFGVPQNVSVFETNIRVLGGLLSAHQLAEAFVHPTSVDKMEVFDKEGAVRIGTSDLQEYLDFIKEVKSASSDQCEGTSTYNEDLQVDVEASCGQASAGAEDGSRMSCTTKSSAKSKANTTVSAGTIIEHWAYDGFLLDLAHDLGRRLLPAFDSKTGIPYGTVNLMTGIPQGETTIASLAGGGTLTLEMELLSHLTGDESFGNAAKLASRALWMRRSPLLQLFGKHIEIQKGEWTETLSGIGSNSDSFYEYLIKHYILFPDDDDFWVMFVAAYNGVYNGTRLGEWYVDADMNLGLQKGAGRRVFESLMAFYPGMQILLGELAPASRTLNSFFMVRELLGVLPERFNYGNWKVDGGPGGGAKHPLRPELLESCYFLHRASRGLASGQSPLGNQSTGASSGWLWAADFALDALHRMTDTKRCGYATVDNTGPTTSGSIPGREDKHDKAVQLSNEMPSFFLSETLKYLYLAFDDDNILHNDNEREWIFTTEAHPIHSVPQRIKDEEQDESELSGLREGMENMLKRRLALNGNKTQSLLDARASVLSMEKWTINSQLPSYMNGIRKSETETLIRKQSRLIDRGRWRSEVSILSDVVRPFAVPPPEDAILSRTGSNVAYMSIGDLGLGDGSSLMKACPNFHSSSLDWIRALNGGVVDYSSIYLSSVMDEGFDHSGTLVLSASDALAFQGSGLYLGVVNENDGWGCPVSDENRTAFAHQAEESASLDEQIEPSPEGMERVDMGGDAGLFDVSVFTEGAGFFVRHVNSGETITATIIEEPKHGATGKSKAFNPFVMIHATTPPIVHDGSSNERSSKDDGHAHTHLTGTSWKDMYRRVENDPPHDVEQSHMNDRSVVFTDTNYGPFRCEVELVETSGLYDRAGGDTCSSEIADECDEEVVDKEIVLAIVPCAPGLFGPALVSNLGETGGVMVEAPITPPDDADPAGCADPCDLERKETAFGISIVRRGECTFESKAVNQRVRAAAEAVIIINNIDEELFMMSGGRSEDPNACSLEETEVPVTVLVSGQDGEKILSIMHDYENLQGADSGVTLKARVKLLPPRGKLTANGVVKSDSGPDDVDWPVLRSTPEAIQVLAEGGWGVHAMTRSVLNQAVGGKANARDWQLFLLRHDKAGGGE